MTKGRRRPNANERLPAMSKIELLLSRLVDDERQVYLAIQQQAMHRTMDGGLGWCLRWEMIEEHNLWLDQKVAIAAQSHVDDTYLPTNKQPPPSSAINHHCTYVISNYGSAVVLCLRVHTAWMQRHLIGSKSVQKGRKEEHQRPNFYSLRSSTIRWFLWLANNRRWVAK